MNIINIKEKIEQINKQPEYVRKRYMWGCVAFSMFILVIVWFFSIFSALKSSNKVTVPTDNQAMTSIQDQVKAIQEQTGVLKEGIEGLGNQSIEAIKESNTVDQQNASKPTNSSLENSASKIPESSSYSKLPKPSTDAAIQQ